MNRGGLSTFVFAAAVLPPGGNEIVEERISGEPSSQWRTRLGTTHGDVIPVEPHVDFVTRTDIQYVPKVLRDHHLAFRANT